MFRYLKEAFLFKVPIPGLGSIPVNLILAIGFLILGFGHPGFWFIGLGLEACILYFLSTNSRFRKWIDLRDSEQLRKKVEVEKALLVDVLKPAAQQRLSQLEQKCSEVIERYKTDHAEGFQIETNREALSKLKWVFLKLLIAQNNLELLGKQTSEEGLKRQISLLESELTGEAMSESVKASKEATLDILNKRLQNFSRREESLQEIESDLQRVEAQVDLALENATLQGQPQEISANIDLFSRVLDSDFFGESREAIARVDETLRN